jgi:hypothetical protein
MPESPILTAPRQPLRRGRAARVVLGVWIALYLLVVGAAPIVDALAGHGEAVVAHWEDGSDERCPPKHEELGCQFVQAYSVGGAVHASVAAATAELQRESLPPSVADRLGWSSVQRVALPSRGPPAQA